MAPSPRRTRGRRPPPAADHGRSEAAAAVSAFLDALGLPKEVRFGKELRETPRRVAGSFLDELVDGYEKDPAEILAHATESGARDLVLLTGIDYVSVCPHHLLPSRGVAHVAYLPRGRVVGFGRLVELVDALSHRLVLAEDLALEVASALERHLSARGAACILVGEHLCLSTRGQRRPRARAHVEAFTGELAERGPERSRLLALCSKYPSADRGRTR